MKYNSLFDSLFTDEKTVALSTNSIRKVRLLAVDLERETQKSELLPDNLVKAYPGGGPLALRLWADYARWGGENLIVITTGLLVSTKFPGGEGFSVAFHSPVTDKVSVVNSYVSFGQAMHGAGFDAIVIRGSFQSLGILEIVPSGAVFRSALKLKGATTDIIELEYASSQKASVMSIGPAGEKGVPFAAPVCEDFTIGRGGLGALMGEKNLKAIVAFGSPVPFPDFDAKKADGIRENFRKSFINHYVAESVRAGGSPFFFKNANREAFVPLSNFTFRSDPRVFHLAGGERERKFDRNYCSCPSCMMLCRHTDREGRPTAPFEASAMLGTNLGIFDPAIVDLEYRTALSEGLDPVSLGNVLGWCKEAAGLGFIPNFSFPTTAADIKTLIEDIASRYGLGEHLSLGTVKAAERFGGSEFAYATDGLEAGPFDLRGCHALALLEEFPLESTDYWAVYYGVPNGSSKETAERAIWEKNAAAVFSMLGICPLHGLLLVKNFSLLRRETVGLFAMRHFPSLSRRILNFHTIEDAVYAILGYKLNLSLLSSHFVRIADSINKTAAPGATGDVPVIFRSKSGDGFPITDIVPFKESRAELRERSSKAEKKFAKVLLKLAERHGKKQSV